MSDAASALWNVLTVALFLVGVYFTFVKTPWLYDYCFSPRGIDIVGFGGRVRFGRLARENIRRVQVVPLADITQADRLITFSLSNRFKTEYIVVDTTYFIRRWSLTPANPRAAFTALDWTAED